MKKEEIQTYEIVLTPDEAKIVVHALDYCHHRLTTEVECGITGILEPERVQKMRKDLRELTEGNY